jgi:hypothetical protein
MNINNTKNNNNNKVLIQIQGMMIPITINITTTPFFTPITTTRPTPTFQSNEASFLEPFENQPYQNKRIPVCVEFINIPGATQSCWDWSDWNLSKFIKDLINNRLPQHLKDHEDQIKSGKLFVSTKSVLNGEWIQIQGDGS